MENPERTQERDGRSHGGGTEKPDGHGGATWPALLLGFGLGGFFDGILLHQVLQWHHLLSAVEAARGDLRLLILWDGIFHVLMYAITGIGLWLLWRHRSHAIAAGADRRLLADALIGFGTWHCLDAVLSHWILGIHRIRMGVENPLLWDLGWLAVFGILPALIGWRLRRRPDEPGAGGGTGLERRSDDGRGRAGKMAMLLVLLCAIGAPVAGLPAETSTTATLVLLAPGTAPADAARGLQVSGARLIWSNPEETVWAVDLPEGASGSPFYRHGALLVSNRFLPAGCLNWFAAPDATSSTGNQRSL
ncbi:DUF2243 domain-containing protein [Rhizobium sp. SL86]|uniref:DUF2243 domain-containing protein n=1 Tax=Rhizobium sp. SL86 TaxID=2995148 RepID=UPI0022764A35|nr:DUF2243 domain-containing protein [Rhizobium sp. SL86]MCY1664286.1 DUF2243 domain-containing protein [Rhizobium sp. SL86]